MKFAILSARMRELNALLSCLTKEAAIMTDDGGWEIRATDEAHVALLMLRVSKSAFLTYGSDDDQIVLDLEKLKKMLAHIKGCEVLTMGQHSIHKEFRSITKLGFFNPRLNKVYTLDVSSISPDVISDVSSNVIGYKNQ